MNPIKNLCLKEQGKNPYIIAQKLMCLNGIPMHGPIHHFIDGAAFMTAMHNAGVRFDLEKGLDALFERSKMMPGATCGNWGVCGAAEIPDGNSTLPYGAVLEKPRGRTKQDYNGKLDNTKLLVVQTSDRTYERYTSAGRYYPR